MLSFARIASRVACPRPAALPARRHNSDSLIDAPRRIFSEEHHLFRDMCRKWVQKEVVPFHAQWEEDGQVPRDLWRSAGSHGLLAANCPEEYGGSDSGILTAAIVWEELSYAGATGPGFALHSDIVMPYILHYGSTDQKSRLLPLLASGEMVGAIAMTEPAAGSDLQGIQTHAAKKGNNWILNGSKTFITNGQHADVVIVVAKTDASKGAHGISLFLVERGMGGFSRGRNLKKLGLRAQDTSELFFEDVELPPSALLGEEGKGFYYLMQELPQERLLIADISVSAAEAAFEITRTHVKERQAFGKPLSKQQVLRHRLAELKTEIVVGRTFLDHCLDLHSRQELTTSTASMAKYWCSDLQWRVLDECVQLHGGVGYMWEYAVCRGLADARVQRIYGGTNEIMKELISRDL